MTDNLVAIIRNRHALTALDAGEYSEMKVSGMKFTISAFHAEGLGHVSVMNAKGFFGLMKMETLIIVPDDEDRPLFSYDLINAMGNMTLYLEMYDTVAGVYDASPLDALKEKYSSIPDHDPGKHWYDDIRLKESIYKKDRKNALIPSLAEEFLKTYIESPASKTEERKLKKTKTKAYVDGLISHGGPSTDVFKKNVGEEKTKDLFEKVLFGTAL